MRILRLLYNTLYSKDQKLLCISDNVSMIVQAVLGAVHMGRASPAKPGWLDSFASYGGLNTQEN